MEKRRRIEINGVEYLLKLFIERRSNTRASITNHSINLRIPKQLPKRDQEKAFKELLGWAVQKVKDTSLGKEKEIKYENGNILRTHSKIYKLQIETRDSQKNFAKIQRNNIIFKIANKHDNEAKQQYISKQLRKLLAKAHQKDLEYYVNKINNQHFNKEIKGVKYKYTKSRWGVCKINKRQIELSTKLLLAPLEIQDYVIVHELAHLIEGNHSRRFWAIVKSVDPNFKKKKKWLRDHGNELHI